MYAPNVNDPRIADRIKKSIIFVERYVSATSKGWLSRDHINNHLGASNRDLGKFLREKLLICVNEYYNKETGKCKEYILNEAGLNEIKELLANKQVTIHYSVAEVAEHLQKQLISGNFEYRDSSDRKFNPIQNIRRAAKKQILSANGYCYQYDIQCSAPTLLFQRAKQLGLESWSDELHQYLNDRNKLRQHIADECEIPLALAKKIITALFQGSHISHSHKTSIYKDLNGDHARIDWLKEDQQLSVIREDIKQIWQTLKPLVQKRTITNKNGVIRSLPTTGKQKTALYRNLEREVLNVIEIYLKENTERYFLEHDGWSCDSELDIDQLKRFIKEHTGYQIEIDLEIIAVIK